MRELIPGIDGPSDQEVEDLFTKRWPRCVAGNDECLRTCRECAEYERSTFFTLYTPQTWGAWAGAFGAEDAQQEASNYLVRIAERIARRRRVRPLQAFRYAEYMLRTGGLERHQANQELMAIDMEMMANAY